MKLDRNLAVENMLLPILFCLVSMIKSELSTWTSSPYSNSTALLAADDSGGVSQWRNSSLTIDVFNNFASSTEPTHLISLHQRFLNHSRLSTTDHFLFGPVGHFSMDYMMSLYSYKSGLGKKPRDQVSERMNRALRRSDIVRQFEIVESFRSSKTLKIIFDTSAVLFHERIRMAELKIESETVVDTIELWDERRKFVDGKPLLVNRKIGNVRLCKKPTTTIDKVIPWRTVDVTRVLRRWYNAHERSEHLKRDWKIESQNRKYASKSNRGKRKQRSLPQAGAVLFVYSTNKNIELSDVATSRQNRNRRTSKRNQTKRRFPVRRRKLQRKNPKRNRTKLTKLMTVKKPRHNEVEMEYPGQLEGPYFSKEKREKDELDEWMAQQSHVTVVKNVSKEIKKKKEEKNKVEKFIRSTEGVVSKPSVLTTSPATFQNVRPTRKVKKMTATTFQKVRPTRKVRKMTNCRRVPYMIDFEKLGWTGWIVHPQKYNAYRCVGKCSRSQMVTGNPTNHAYLKAGLSVSKPERGIPEPCCVPSKLLPLDILFFEEGTVTQRVHEEMIVAECECI